MLKMPPRGQSQPHCEPCISLSPKGCARREQGPDAGSDPGAPAREGAGGREDGCGVRAARLPSQDFLRPPQLLCWQKEQQAPGLRRRSGESDFN